MSDYLELKEIQRKMEDQDLIKKYRVVLEKLKETNGNSFTMTVPARADDTDMIISDLFNRYSKTIVDGTEQHNLMNEIWQILTDLCHGKAFTDSIYEKLWWMADEFEQTKKPL